MSHKVLFLKKILSEHWNKPVLLSLWSAPFSLFSLELWAAWFPIASTDVSSCFTAAVLVLPPFWFSSWAAFLPPLLLGCPALLLWLAPLNQILLPGLTKKSAAWTLACLTLTTNTCALLNAPVTQLHTPLVMPVCPLETSLLMAAPSRLPLPTVLLPSLLVETTPTWKIA